MQYQRSLLQDLPIAARSYSVTQPSGLSALLGSTGDVSSLIQSLFGLGGGASGPSGDIVNRVSDEIIDLDNDAGGT